VKAYLKENQKAARSLPQVIAEFERFQECIAGDKPMSSITKDDGRKYKTYLVDERKVKWATVSKHLSILSGLFRWAERQGYLADAKNPIHGLIPDKKTVRKEKRIRKPFDDAQLLSIFGSQDFISQRGERPERFWVIVLLLFSGARRDEIAQLRLDDICEEAGIPYLRVTNEGLNQSVKNPGSKRRIPVHSSVVQLGFMEYVQSLRGSKHAQLFPQLSAGPNGFGDAVGKYFARLLEKVGLTDSAYVMHSLRKSAITRLHEAGVPEKHVQILTGHSSSTVHEQYIHRDMVALSVLRDALEKLRYDEVVRALGEPH
jgi:integrase